MAEKHMQLKRKISGPGILQEAFETTSDTTRTIIAFMDASTDMFHFLTIYLASEIAFEPVEEKIAEALELKHVSRKALLTRIKEFGKEFVPHRLLTDLEAIYQNGMRNYDVKRLTEEMQRATLHASEHVRKAKLKTMLKLS